MPERLIKYKFKILFATMFVFLLIVVRVFEEQLFYDPFLQYYKLQYGGLPLPEVDHFKLFWSLAARYFLNAFFSLGIILTLFKDADLIKFSAVLYVLFFIVLIGVFFWALYFVGTQNKMLLFYIRRFLIQPIFLLLFLPAFYYQKVVSKK